jgi:hypothetical protein
MVLCLLFYLLQLRFQVFRCVRVSALIRCWSIVCAPRHGSDPLDNASENGSLLLLVVVSMVRTFCSLVATPTDAHESL